MMRKAKIFCFMLILMISSVFCIAFVSAKPVHYDYYESYASFDKNEKWHILDFGEVLTAYDIDKLTLSFNPKDECETKAYIYLSKDGENWRYFGETDLTAVPITKDFNVEDDFRYIKIGSFKCYTSFSAAGIILKERPEIQEYMLYSGGGGGDYEEPQVPEFSSIAAGVALIGAIAGFIFLRRRN